MTLAQPYPNTTVTASFGKVKILSVGLTPEISIEQFFIRLNKQNEVSSCVGRVS